MLKEMTRTEDLTRTGWCKVHQGTFKPGGDFDRERLLSVGICGDCDFWMEKWRMRDDTMVARINGAHYIIGEPSAAIKGMGGAVARIRFNDGRWVVTDNLWHQGDIPDHFRELLPDNADFAELVTKAEG